METQANYLVVASFVLAIVALAVIGAIWVLNLQPIPEARAQYDIYFSGSVVGLKVNAPVSLSGIPIGRVRKVEVDPEDPARVHVTIEVQKGTAIKTDSVASLEINLMFGDASVGVTAGSSSAPPLAALPGRPYPIIASQASQFESITQWVADFVQRTSDALDTLIKALDDENRQAISEGLQRAEQATARAVGQTQGFGNTIDAAASMVQVAHGQVAAFNVSLPELDRGLNNAQSDIQDIDAVIKEVGIWARDFDNSLSSTRRQQVADFRNTMSDLAGMISGARDVVRKLARYIDAFERDPTHALFGKTGGGYTPTRRP